jgi:dGTPase
MMQWTKLLDPRRIRPASGGKPSQRTSGETRTEFERDYGRAIFSTPVRRLQDKAQVFPLAQSDFVRTRLTHSIEVSSVARGLSSTVGQWLVDKGELTAEAKGSVEFIAATCGIIHDLGNPPFGHAGEDALSEWCKQTLDLPTEFPSNNQCQKDFEKWNGNAQTMRLIGRLQLLADRYGLDLTCATLAASRKYLAPSHQIDDKNHDRSKVGYFASENDLIETVRSVTETGDARHPVTILVEASDDIVYAFVDIEDGIKKELLSWERFEEQLRHKAKGCPHVDEVLNDVKEKMDTLYRGQPSSEMFAQAFRTFAINQVVPSVANEFKNRYDDIMNGEYHREIIKDCSARLLVKACKEIAKEFIFQSDEVLRIELMGRKIIHDLMSVFWEGVKYYPHSSKEKPFAQKTYRLMSDNYRRLFEDSVEVSRTGSEGNMLPEMYHRIQLTCDYVAGMTDTFAASLHKQLTNV